MQLITVFSKSSKMIVKDWSKEWIETAGLNIVTAEFDSKECVL
jgi:hypothetical protein